MESRKYAGRNVAWTFVIGFIAGVSPFLFMKLLPDMLNPGLHLDPPNYYAIVMTGALIGAITAIIFATTFEKRDPQEIFFYALGIPAILIATVSNLSTQFSAMNEISTVKESLSGSLLSPPAMEKIEGDLKQISWSPSPSLGDGPIIRTASADEQALSRPFMVAKNDFLVVIGTYDRQADAEAARSRYTSTKLRTERYAAKNLHLLETAKKSYLLVYGTYASEAEAKRVYQLLRINDPELPVRILRR